MSGSVAHAQQRLEGGVKVKVGAVIRALNEEEHIGRLLVGLERQVRGLDEIVLVDSGSSDATVTIAEQFGARVRHIHPSNFTFGRSLNYGFEVSTADVVLVLSAHVYPIYDSFVPLMVEPFTDSRVAVTYGRQVGDSRTHFSEQRIMRQWFPETGTGRQTHSFCNNANAAVRRAVWEELKYDEELTGLEDIEFAGRAQESGHDLWYVAEAPVVHVHQESLSQIRNRYRREAMAYARIHKGWRLTRAEALTTAARNMTSDLVQSAQMGSLARNGLGILNFRFAQFLGAWEGGHDGHPVSEEVRKRMYYPASAGDSADHQVLSHTRIDYSQMRDDAHVD